MRIEYRNETGELSAIRYRVGMDAEPRFKWKQGSHVMPYGLERLAHAREAGWVLLVEGESDCWTAWHNGLPTLGVPGKSTWRAEWATLLDGLGVYVWQEPNAEDFTARIFANLPDARVIVAPDGVKDISAAHLAGADLCALLEKLKASAPLAGEQIQDSSHATQARLEDEARRVLEAADPLIEIWAALKASGYGGDSTTPLIVYLAATSRLLAMRPGAMPVHLLLIGPASAGKSYAVRTALSLLPPEATCAIDAGSPRALIYNDENLEHRVLLFGEADSLPAGEDNPAASAVRNLLQDHRLHYDVTVEDRQAGGFSVRHINKPGPTVLITTAVKTLGSQLSSRMFVLRVADTPAQTRAALAAQAQIELHGVTAPDPTLIAYQALLQLQAPWDVAVPFVDELAEAIGRRPADSRVLRDFARLVSLIKAVAVLRHPRRPRDERGRVVATVDDYADVFNLIGDLFEGSVTGAGDTVRELVGAAAELLAGGKRSVSVTELAAKLELTKQATSGRVRRALAGGWLLNEEERRGRAFKLVLGDPLPESTGLPLPCELQARQHLEDESLHMKEGSEQVCQAVKPETARGSADHLAGRDPPPLGAKTDQQAAAEVTAPEGSCP
ncbi:MAG: hypothetical protein P4L93_08205 [Coriobacteriia bacterium]|nr:hypothetical protein [Coriobacteriia bacterium]